MKFKKEETRNLFIRGILVKLVPLFRADAILLGISPGAWLNSAIEGKLKKSKN